MINRLLLALILIILFLNCHKIEEPIPRNNLLDPLSDKCAYLSDLTVDGNTIQGFIFDKTEYLLVMNYGITNITIGYKKCNSGVNVSGDGIKAVHTSLNTYIIIATSADGSNEKTYTINISISPTLGTHTVTNKLGVDTQISTINPTTNLENNTLLAIEANNTHMSRSLTKFNLSSIPTQATVNSCELKLYFKDLVYNSPEKPEQTLIRQINNTWNVSTVTWNTKPTEGTPEDSVAVGEFDPSGWHTFTISLAYIQNWINNPSQNYGFFITLGDEVKPDSNYNLINYYSSDYFDVDKHPTLILNVTFPAY